MARTTWLPLLLIALFGLLLLANRVWGKAAAPGLQEMLVQHRSPIKIGPGGISGPGAELLLREADRARWVLIGEEHGLAEVPWLVGALFRQASPPFEYYAGEFSALAAAKTRELALDPQGGPAAFGAWNRRYPCAMAFGCTREEAEVLSLIAGKAKLVGLDQEFLFAPAWLLDEVAAALRPLDSAGADALAAAVAAERASWTKLAGGAEQAPLFLFEPLPEGWERWKSELAGAPHALAAMAALEESRRIYLLYQEGHYYENNLERGRLMKSRWRAAAGAACAGQGRVLVRLGSNHAIRGLSPLGIADFGNFAAEMAAAEGAESLHVLVLATGGARNGWLPITPAEAAASPIDLEGDEVFGPLYQSLPKGGRAIYDLRPLREHFRLLAGGTAAIEKLLLGYDLVLVLDQGHPAGFLEGLEPLNHASGSGG